MNESVMIDRSLWKIIRYVVINYRWNFIKWTSISKKTINNNEHVNTTWTKYSTTTSNQCYPKLHLNAFLFLKIKDFK